MASASTSSTTSPNRRVGSSIRQRIRAPRSRQEPSDDVLRKLSSAILSIQAHNAASLSFEEHYRHAYALVLAKKGDVLHRQVSELIRNHLFKIVKEKIEPIMREVKIKDGGGVGGMMGEEWERTSRAERFLVQVRLVWEDHLATMKKLRDVLKYMDKVYAPSSSSLVVWDLGLKHFLEVVFHYPKSESVIPLSINTPDVSRNEPTKHYMKESNIGSGYLSSDRGQAPPPTFSVYCPQHEYVETVQHHLIRTLLMLIRFERTWTAPKITSMSSIMDPGPSTSTAGISLTRHTLKSITDMFADLIDGRPVQVTPKPQPLNQSHFYRSEHLPGSVALDGDNVYKREFEEIFLQETREWYEEEGTRLITGCDGSEYLKKVEIRLKEEEQRCLQYLQPVTLTPLRSLLDHVLLTFHLTEVLNHPQLGLPEMLEQERMDDLQRLFRLSNRIPGEGLPKLREGVKSYFKETGRKINEGVNSTAATNANNDTRELTSKAKGKGKAVEGVEQTTVGSANNAALLWVKSVLDLKDKFHRVSRDAFQDEKLMLKEIDDGFETFINQNAKSPEFISLYLDDHLRKGVKNKTEGEIETALEHALLLFRYLSNKDVFEKYYKKHLAKRLMYQRSASDDAERQILSKLKAESGAQFTRDLEGMLKDMKASTDLSHDYKKFCVKKDSKPAFDLNIQVLTSSFWPLQTERPDCNLPTQFTGCIEQFEAYYKNRHSGRKLTWFTQFGTVDMKMKFMTRSHEVNLPTMGAVVSLLFEGLEDDEMLSFEEIQRTTSIPVADLKRTLQSLACGKHRILTKTPKGRDVNDDDKFTFNHKFKSETHRIKIQTVVNKVETGEERKETLLKVEEERRLITEAVIVRVMKNRKVAPLNDLVTEVTKQLISRFQMQPRTIKLCVEKLIEKEYLERDEKDSKRLKYLA